MDVHGWVFGMKAAHSFMSIRNMNDSRNPEWYRFFRLLTLTVLLFLGIAVGSGSTYDFGCVPLGTTNTANGFNFLGGSWNGTNLVMSSETFIGPNAADFLTNTNYTGQTLPPG